MEATLQDCFSAHRGRYAFLLSLVLLGTLSATGCRAIEQRIVFNPYVYPEKWSDPDADELAGLCFEDVCFESLDGTRLHGWFVRPEGNVSGNPVLFAHGRAGHVSSHKDKLLTFVRRTQTNVFLFDYRGFGKSGGYPTEDGLYLDVAAARDWLARRADVDPCEVVLIGRSLGAAAVIDLAAREGGKAVIIQSSFTSTPDVVKHHSHGILNGSRMMTCFNSECKIGAYTGPVFISHSRDDKALPFSHGVRLAEAATQASRVWFMELKGGHSAPPSDEYYVVLADFLDSLNNSDRVLESRKTIVAANSPNRVKP